MNEQLKRIREKDYSAIDQTLFQNMARADQFDSTISQLGEFQQFLMKQISLLNSNQKNNEATSLRCSITKNFDTLRESLVHCSRIAAQSEGSLSGTVLKKQLATLKEQIFRSKKEMKQAMQQVRLQTMKLAEQTMGEVLAVLQRERGARLQAQERCFILQKQKEQLLVDCKIVKKEETSQLVKKIKKVNNQNQPNQIKWDSVPLSLIVSEKKRQHPSSPGKQSIVLKEFRGDNFGCSGLVSIPSFSEKAWKICPEGIRTTVDKLGSEDIVSKGIQKSEPRRQSLTRQTSNHRLCSKQNISLTRQNEALRSKGVHEQRRRSKQKIKIYSLI